VKKEPRNVLPAPSGLSKTPVSARGPSDSWPSLVAVISM
jgi:hypothetical protein